MLEQIFEALSKNGRKVKGFEDLNAAERETFKQWQEILYKKEVTIQDLTKFLPAELERARRELEKYENGPEKEMFFKAYVRVLQVISAIIMTPETQREQLKQELKQRFNL